MLQDWSSTTANSSSKRDGFSLTVIRERLPKLLALARLGDRGAAAAGREGPIVPPDSVAGQSLTLVIAIMCFLACLTAGIVHMFSSSAAAWTENIASEITVQIEPIKGQDTDKRLTEVALFLAKQPGVSSVNPLSMRETERLLEPWLGKSDVLSAVPMPRLIAVLLDRDAQPDVTRIQKELASRFNGVLLDDHRRWQAEIRSMTRSLTLAGLAILTLVALATVAVIVSATRSALASNREIVEVLNFVGARDRFIAREFEKHFLTLGVKAGVMGAVAAALTFLALPAIFGAVNDVGASESIQRLLGTGSLPVAGYLWFVAVVVVVASLCMVTSRIGVKRILASRA